jgi:hypothetical protein
LPHVSHFPQHCGTKIVHSFDLGVEAGLDWYHPELLPTHAAIRSFVGAFINTHACKQGYEKLTALFGPPVSQTPILSRKGFGNDYLIAVWYKD